MSPSCPGGIAEPGRAIFSRAPPQLDGLDEGQWVSRRAAAGLPVVCGAEVALLQVRRPVQNAKGKWVWKSARIGPAMPFPFIPTPIGPVQPRGRRAIRAGAAVATRGSILGKTSVSLSSFQFIGAWPHRAAPPDCFAAS